MQCLHLCPRAHQELVASPKQGAAGQRGQQGSCCRDSTKAAKPPSSGTACTQHQLTLAVPQLEKLCSKNMKSSRKSEWKKSIKHSDMETPWKRLKCHCPGCWYHWISPQNLNLHSKKYSLLFIRMNYPNTTSHNPGCRSLLKAGIDRSRES